MIFSKAQAISQKTIWKIWRCPRRADKLASRNNLWGVPKVSCVEIQWLTRQWMLPVIISMVIQIYGVLKVWGLMICKNLRMTTIIVLQTKTVRMVVTSLQTKSIVVLKPPSTRLWGRQVSTTLMWLQHCWIASRAILQLQEGRLTLVKIKKLSSEVSLNKVSPMTTYAVKS